MADTGRHSSVARYTRTVACQAEALARDVLQAIRFLTILGVGPAARFMGVGTGDRPQPPLADCIHVFPVVGALVGALAGGVWLLAGVAGLPPLLAAGLAVAAAAVLTGGLHEDGLGDVADGFGGGRTRDDKLRIMRDSRIGSFGALAVVFSIGLRVAALAALPVTLGLAALVAAGALSRATLPAILWRLPSARTAGLAADAGRPSTWQVGMAAGVSVALALLLLAPPAAAAATAGAALGAAAVAVIACRQIGGHTGDVCGAAQQAAETAALIAVVALS